MKKVAVGALAATCLTLSPVRAFTPASSVDPSHATFYTVDGDTNLLKQVSIDELKPGDFVVRISDGACESGRVEEGARPVTHPDGVRGIEVDHRTYQSVPRSPRAS